MLIIKKCMHSIKIDIGKNTHDFQHPEKFNELTEEQYLLIVSIVLMQGGKFVIEEDNQLRLLYALLGGLKQGKKKRAEIYKVINKLIDNLDLNLADLISLQNFITKEQDFNNWLLPEIKIKKQTFYAPDSRFASMRFGEFISVDMLISAYFGSKKPEAILNKIIAVLYREKRKDIPKNFKGDKRELFNSETLEHRENIIKDIDEVTKKAILYNYTGVRNWLSKKYVMVFSSSDTSKRTNIVLGKQENSWLSIRRHLAGGALNLEKTDQLNLHDVLSSLNEEMKKD